MIKKNVKSWVRSNYSIFANPESCEIYKDLSLELVVAKLETQDGAQICQYLLMHVKIRL